MTADSLIFVGNGYNETHTFHSCAFQTGSSCRAVMNKNMNVTIKCANMLVNTLKITDPMIVKRKQSPT